MELNVEALQELAPAQEVGLEGCPILGSCCLPPGNLFFTIVSCFGCTFTN